MTRSTFSVQGSTSGPTLRTGDHSLLGDCGKGSGACLLLAAFCLLPSLHAQQPPASSLQSPASRVLRLTLKKAVEIALEPEGNARVQIAEQMTRQAQARSGQARASLLPDLSGSLARQSQTRNLAAMGIRIQVPIPGFVFPTFVGPFSVVDARASVAQSIFDFSAIRRFQASRAGVRMAGAESDTAREQAAEQVARAYMAAMRADASLETAQANVKLAESLVKLAEDQKAAGTGTGIEVTRALVQLANERQRLLVAENEQSRTRLQLLKALGLPLDTEVELADKLGYVQVPDVAVERARAAALESRPDWKAQQRREESARLNYSATKMERLPSLAGFADYGAMGTGFDAALPTRTYGVALRVPVFDGGRRDARRAESFAQLRQEQIRGGDLREQIELEIRVARNSLRSAEEQVRAAEEGLKLAEDELAQARRRYEAGVTSGIEVTDAQTRLARAQENRIAALFSHNMARLDLAAATGTVRKELLQ
jgi:outer membrane protein